MEMIIIGCLIVLLTILIIYIAYTHYYHYLVPKDLNIKLKDQSDHQSDHQNTIRNRDPTLRTIFDLQNFVNDDINILRFPRIIRFGNDFENLFGNDFENMFGNDFENLFPTNPRNTNIQSKHIQAREQSEGIKSAQTDAFVNLSTEHINDPENSHDSAVIDCSKSILSILRNDPTIDIKNLPSITEINKTIMQDGMRLSEGRPYITIKAMKVLDSTRVGDINLSIGASDDEVLRLVWNRSLHPQNVENKEKMKQAIFDALVSCWEDDHIVCVNGRTSRLLSSLSMLDFDKSTWSINTLQSYKNEILQMTKNLIQSFAEYELENSSPEWQKVARSYLITTPNELKDLGEIDSATEICYEDKLIFAIEAAVDFYILENKLSTRIGDILKKEATSAVRIVT